MTANNKIEKKLWAAGYNLVCGVDESGMGSLVGNVYTAAVVFPADFDYDLLPGLNDSKKLTAEKREQLYPLIKKYAVSSAVATASVEEIAEYNIYWARFIAVRRALAELTVRPNYVLMDGNAKIPEIDIPQSAIIKGDTKSASIAAASVLAKVDRDRYMVELASRVHPDYDWANNKAYHSKKHVEALAKHGKTKWHRAKFIRKFDVAGESK